MVKAWIRPLDRGMEQELEYFRLAEGIYPDAMHELFLLTETREGVRIWRTIDCSHYTFLTLAAQQEAGPRSKRHPKSVEGLGVKGEGEQ